jgi:addiction module HigA family antidote
MRAHGAAGWICAGIAAAFNLQNNRAGQYSIRINQQWRLCFRWQGDNAQDAELPTAIDPPAAMKTKKPAAEKLLPSVHPGEVLMEEFMRPLGLTAYRVARDIGSIPITISKIIRGLRAISPEMALRRPHDSGFLARPAMLLRPRNRSPRQIPHHRRPRPALPGPRLISVFCNTIAIRDSASLPVEYGAFRRSARHNPYLNGSLARLRCSIGLGHGQPGRITIEMHGQCVPPQSPSQVFGHS